MSEPIADIRPIRFWKKYVANPEGGMREVEWVEWARRGEAKYTTTPMPIKHAKANTQIWPALEPFYEAWLKGQTLQVAGTPLDAWVGITAEQIDVLKSKDCYSLEDLADMTDSQREKIGLPGLINLQQGARRFLQGLSGGKVDAALAEKDAQIAALQAQMEQLMEAMAPQAASEERRRGPGRPRKDEAEAA